MNKNRDCSLDEEMDELKALAEELAGAAVRMEKKLDATLAKVAAYEEALADREGLKAAARADLEASGLVWPFDPPQEPESKRASE